MGNRKILVFAASGVLGLALLQPGLAGAGAASSVSTTVPFRANTALGAASTHAMPAATPTSGLKNGDFDSGLQGWSNTSSGNAQVTWDSDGTAAFRPTATGTARLTQSVQLSPNTDYVLKAQTSKGGPLVMIGAKRYDGRWSQTEAKAEEELRFRTGAEPADMTVYLQAWKQQSGTTQIDNVTLQPANEPSPTPSPTTTPAPTPTPTPTPSLSPQPSSSPTSPDPTAPSEPELLANPTFATEALLPWNDTSTGSATVSQVTQQLLLRPASGGVARVTQQVAVSPNTKYQLSLNRGGASGSAAAHISVKGHQGKWSAKEDQRDLTFTTTADVSEVSISIHAWKGQSGFAIINGASLVRYASPTPTPTPTPTPSETTPPAGTNLVQNSGFESGLEGWETQRGTPQVDPDDGTAGAAVKFVPGKSQTVRVEQRLTGLRPETKYTFAAQVRTQGADVWAGYGIESGAQVSKTNSVQAADWAEKRFTFYTKSGADSVTVFLESFQTDTPGYVLVDNVRVIEGDLPLPSAPDAGWLSPPATVSLPAAGQQIVRNGDFTDGAAQWSLDDGSVQSDTLTLQSSADKTARAVQDTGVLLASNKTYELNVRARASSGQPTVGIVVGSNYHHATVTAANFTDYRVRFTTTQAQESGKILLERWKGSPGTLEVQSVSLFAEGGEWLDTPDPVPTRTTTKLVEEFDGPLDPNKWLIVDRAWGGDNGGLVPENATLGNGILKLAGHGDQYSGNVVGHGGRKTRVGAGIATRDYYASGKYVVRARLPKELGAVSAFWSFHYIEKFPSEPGYWDEPNRIRNTEIDWEFPTDLSNGTMHDPISYQNGRANTWGGKFGGEGAHHPGRIDFGQSVADGKFHDFGIEWHSGSDTQAGRVIWTLDGEEVYRHEGSVYGQDNIPYRGARFWIGLWFPASGFTERINGEREPRVGWAGDPDFDATVLEIDRVEITPFNDPADVWEAETWPNGWYAAPSEYPDAP